MLLKLTPLIDGIVPTLYTYSGVPPANVVDNVLASLLNVILGISTETASLLRK